MQNLYNNVATFLNIQFCHQCSETNVVHFLFNLLRIKGLCMFLALLAHPQDALHKRHLVYCVRVMSVGCTRIYYYYYYYYYLQLGFHPVAVVTLHVYSL
jgi:hypothetical protein